MLEQGRSLTGGAEMVNCPIEESVKIVRSGEFAVGHLPNNERTRSALGPFTPVVLRRELRAALVSCFRFFHETGRVRHDLSHGVQRALVDGLQDWGKGQIALARGVAGWPQAPGVVSLTYEQLRDPEGAGVKAIAGALGLDIDDPAAVARESLGSRKLTSCRREWSVDDAWSDEAESLFVSLGGEEVNAELGFTSAAARAAS